MTNIGACAAWNIIKSFLVTTSRNVKNKKINDTTSIEVSAKRLSFGLQVQLDENTLFNFELDGALDEKIILKSLDKFVVFLKERKLNQNYKKAYYITYNSDNDIFTQIDIE